MENDDPTDRACVEGSADQPPDRLEAIPAAVALPLLGILGGICGEPVSVWLRDHPPDVLGAVQRHLVQAVPPGRVCELFGRADMQLLARRPERFMLVLIDPIRGHQSSELAAQWLINRRRGTRTPAALFGPDDGIAHAPGAMITLRSQPLEAARLRTWLLRNPSPDDRIRRFLLACGAGPTALDFGVLSHLVAGSGPAPAWKIRTLRSMETLRGLLAGRALLRMISEGPDDLRTITVEDRDYASVRQLLWGLSISSPEEAADPLLVAMIGRINHHLRLRIDPAAAGDASRAGRQGNSSRASSSGPGGLISPHRPITLREVVDLGNGRSALAKHLVADIARTANLDAFRGLGLLREPPGPSLFQGACVDDLIGWLRTWTEKQARTRFDRLRRQGFIEASRPSGNGAWLYQIPEACGDLPGEFRGLPTVDHLRAARPDAGTPPDPRCPPPALPCCQTETPA